MSSDKQFKLRGGGGGVRPDFLKFDFEIAVDQQTKAHDRTFEAVSDSESQPVPAGQPRPYLVNLLVATSLLNTYITFFIIKIG